MYYLPNNYQKFKLFQRLKLESTHHFNAFFKIKNFFTISMSFVELQRNEINDYAYQKSPHQTFFTLTLSCDVQHHNVHIFQFMNFYQLIFHCKNVPSANTSILILTFVWRWTNDYVAFTLTFSKCKNPKCKNQIVN